MPATAKIPTTFVGYVRISKDRPGETSTDTQERDIRRWAELHGKELVAVIVEPGRSAFNIPWRKRPGARQAMGFVETGAADGFVSWKIDRAIRNVGDFADLLGHLAGQGAAYASVLEPVDTSDPMGQAMAMIIAVLAQLESATKSQRTIGWQEGRRLNGRPPTGPRAYGYRRVRGELVIDETEAAVIREAAAALLADQPDTLRAVVRRLNEAGVKPRLADAFDRRSLKQMLTRPTIAGLIADGDSFVEGAWEPIIDRATFDELRAVLLDPDRHPGGTNQRRWLLSGFARCARDDAPLIAQRSSWGQRYQCPTCALSIDAAKTEQVVTSALLGNLDPTAWRRMRRRGHHVDTRALETELDELAAAWAEGRITPERHRIVAEGIQRRIDNAARAPVALPNVDDVRREWPNLPVSARRLILTAAVATVVIAPAQRGANRFDDARVQIPADAWKL